MMRAELGANTPTQMINLYQSIRTPGRSPQTEIEPKWEIHPSVEVPFVGRKKALIAINRAIEEQRGIVILGESGQGKSRLVQEYIQQLHPRPRVLITICRPTESTLPFHPIVEMFRRYVSADEWLSLSAIWANQLTGLLPEIAQMRDDLEPLNLPADADQAQAMIFESIRQGFVLMAKDHPLFLVIDDAHWADEATLSTIAYLLVREPFTQSASLALVARLEDMKNSLRSMLDSIQQSKHATIYELDHLHRGDITNLAQYLLKSPPSTHFIDRLINYTGGNTFFVLEILRAMLAAGTRNVTLDAILPLTENLQSLIISRIEKLSPKAKEILEVAAIIGAEFSVQILSKSSHHTLEELAAILEELENNLLVKPCDQHQERLFYHFTHDKIRETLLNQISPAKAQVLHARVINALTLNQTPEAGVLAHHYSGAGELKMAFRYWIKAAERARSLFAREDTSRNYARAEQLLQHIEPELSNDDIYHFYADWNDLAYNVNETELLKKIGNELIRLGKNRNSHLLIGTGLDALSDACMTTNDFKRGLEYVSQAVSHLELSDKTFEHIEAYNHHGTFLYMLNRPEEALVSFQDALALSTGEDSDSKIFKARSNAHYQIALLQTLFGNPASGYEHGIKAFEFAELCQHSYSIIQAYSIQALSQYYMGEFSQSRENALLGIELAERIQGWRMLGYLHSYAAIAEVALGIIDSARKHGEEAVRLGEKYGHSDIVALGYRILGELQRLLYNYDQAEKYHQQGVDAVREHFLGLDNLYRLGLTQYYQGKQTGIEQILAARTILEKNSIRVGAIAAKVCQALAYASSDQWQETFQLATELETETLSGGLASYHIIAIILLGETALANDDSETAMDHFRFAAGEAQFMKNPWLEIKAQACIERALQFNKLDTSAPGQRIEALLEQLEKQISSPETRKGFVFFRQQVSNRTWIATDTI